MEVLDILDNGDEMTVKKKSVIPQDLKKKRKFLRVLDKQLLHIKLACSEH